MKKIWVVLLVLLVCEITFFYKDVIAETISSWFNFTLEINIVESSEEPAAEFALYMDAECTMPYSDCGSKTIWTRMEQGQPLYWDRYVKNIGNLGANVSLSFKEDVSHIMTYQFEPQSIYLAPGEVYLVKLIAQILDDAPIGEVEINGYGWEP